MNRGIRLKTLGLILVGVSVLSALCAAWLWTSSTKSWRDFQDNSFIAGIALYEALRTGAPAPEGIVLKLLSADQAALASKGDVAHLEDVPTPAIVTNVSILGPGRDQLSGETMSIGIVSDKIQYSVAQLVFSAGQPASQKFGNVTRLLATYCSEPILIARLGNGAWYRIDGRSIWGCSAAPRDQRLLAALVLIVALAALTTLVWETTEHFDRFSRALLNRRRLGGPQSYAASGPEELRDIVHAVNDYLGHERAQLSKRAMVLSGVSHDLGTPATRLRLRTALIQESELREKLEADIDDMTQMIESVLTYTRAELNEETPRQLSLTSLIEALVADYQDIGKPVSLLDFDKPSFEAGHSVFGSKLAQGAIPGEQRILVIARPIALKRAISNLIENALKYGRRATVSLTATSDHATIAIEDEGSGMSAEDIEAVIAPFKRGDNTKTIDGFGLGLTIVATVAEQHGGQLTFETAPHGLRACLEICRN